MGSEFLQSCGEKLDAFRLLIGIGIRAHKEKQQLWIFWRCGTVHRLQIFELRARKVRRGTTSGRGSPPSSKVTHGADHKQEHQGQTDVVSHQENPFPAPEIDVDTSIDDSN